MSNRFKGAIILWVGGYFLASFIHWNSDPSEWSILTRIVYLALSLLILAAALQRK